MSYQNGLQSDSSTRRSTTPQPLGGTTNGADSDWGFVISAIQRSLLGQGGALVHPHPTATLTASGLYSPSELYVTPFAPSQAQETDTDTGRGGLTAYLTPTDGYARSRPGSSGGGAPQLPLENFMGIP